jgi:hypothetical protein
MADTEVFREVLGTGDGATTVFTLTFDPVLNSEMIFQNELYQDSGIHYTISGKILTFAVPPVAGARLRAWYWTAGGGGGGGGGAGATTDDITIVELLTDAAIEIGAIAAGETLEADDYALLLRKFNRMMGQWNLREVLKYTVRIDRYTLTPVNQASYSIGRGTGAVFVADRPVRIVRANLVLTNAAPEVRVPLAILDDDDWAAIAVTAITSSIPRALYPDGAYPNENLFLWPEPSVAYDLELFTWQALERFANPSDVVSAPPGYLEAMTLTLAEKICSAFGKTRSEELRDDAAKARAAVVSINSQLPRPVIDSPRLAGRDGGQFNFRTGQVV